MSKRAFWQWKDWLFDVPNMAQLHQSTENKPVMFTIATFQKRGLLTACPVGLIDLFAQSFTDRSEVFIPKVVEVP